MKKSIIIAALILSSPATYAATIGIYGGISNLALLNSTPEAGLIVSSKIAGNTRFDLNYYHASANSDDNGGAANVLSTRFSYDFNAGDGFKIGPYIGNEYLSYGHLYNNAVGGGMLSSWRTPFDVILSVHAGAMYGLDGTVGEHLTCPGNLFTFGGQVTVPIDKSWYLFGLGSFDRFVGNGNALTKINLGAGLGYRF